MTSEFLPARSVSHEQMNADIRSLLTSTGRIQVRLSFASLSDHPG